MLGVYVHVGGVGRDGRCHAHIHDCGGGHGRGGRVVAKVVR